MTICSWIVENLLNVKAVYRLRETKLEECKGGETDMAGITKLSVIIPVYNAEKSIEACTQSVLSQGLNECEVLLIDDGSTDDTLRCCETLANADRRIRVLSVPHAGVSAARNAGLSAASGEWLMFLDADDMLIENALGAFETYLKGKFDAVNGLVMRGNEQRHGAKISPKEYIFKATEKHELFDFAMIEPTDRLTCHGWLFRRSVWLKTDMMFDSSLLLGEDSEWILRILTACDTVCFVDLPLYRYSIDSFSVVHQWNPQKLKGYLDMLAKIADTPMAKEKNWPLFVLTNYLLMLTHVVFHPKNLTERKEQFTMARELMKIPVIKDAISQADLSKLDKRKCITLSCLKHNWMMPAYVAIKIRQKQNEMHASK